MQLAELLRRPDLGDDEEAAIYVARPWSPAAEAILVSPAPDAANPIEREGRRFEYFLEAALACDFLEDLEESGDAAWQSEDKRHARLIRYAETDA